jgi:enoyl-CoA hydratase/carnithine racemase
LTDIDQPDVVLFARPSQHIAVVTLNRPAARNAVNRAVACALEAALDTIEADIDIRVAILAATGDKSFCAGADLSEVAAGRGKELATLRGGFAGFVKAQRTKPWIAAIDAPALGGGLELALACDMVVAGDAALFGLPEVKRGIFAGAGGVFRLPRAVPRAIAMEMISTGEPIDARRAYEIGLINRVVPAGQAVAAATALAQAIAANAPIAVRHSLQLARQSYDTSEAQLWPRNLDSMRQVMASDDAREGPRAFLEKRLPQWSGR